MSQERPPLVLTDVAQQLVICGEIAKINQERHPNGALAFVETYGCQQNVSDSQHIMGYLEKMGYTLTDQAKEAQIIVVNTCAIRDHAEQKVYGNLGALVHSKRQNPQQILCVCGCMVQQEAVSAKIKQSFRHVDLVFGTHVLWKFPQFVLQLLTQQGRIFQTPVEATEMVENMPQKRESQVKAWVSIMYGCNNFCTYCIVPYVRGRERSRKMADIVAEVTKLAQDGYKEITLLGQNVNSYGKDLEESTDFAQLLRALNDIEGDFWIRFMTSHPKDAGTKLFQAMSDCGKVAPSLHLPFQSGNDQVLKAMNRGYTREEYLAEIREIRSLVPHITLTSDVIVGFPGETRAQFEDTLSLLAEVGFDALFTFIFSPRSGTPASTMDDPMPKEEKSKNFQEMLDLQNNISAQKHQESLGQILRCLVDDCDGDARYPLSARTPGNRLIRLEGDRDLLGQFVQLKVVQASTWSLVGELV